MYVVAIHAIDDPKTFWDAAQVAVAELPEGTTLHSAIPNEDGSRAGRAGSCAANFELSVHQKALDD